MAMCFPAKQLARQRSTAPMPAPPGQRDLRKVSPPRSGGSHARIGASSGHSLPSTVASVQPPEPVYYLTPADLVRCPAAAVEVAESPARHHLLHRDALIAALDRPRWNAHYRRAHLIDQPAVGPILLHPPVLG